MARLSTVQILKEACEKYGYSCEDVPLKGGTSVKVSNGRKFFYSGFGMDYSVFPINLNSGQKIPRSKWITKQALKEIGEDVIPGQLFRTNEKGRKILPHLSEAPKILPDSLFPIVWKPDVGQRGFNIKFVKDRAELQKQVDLFMEAPKYQKVLIDKYIDLPEYRIFYALGKVYFLHTQRRPQVVGDGATELETLIDSLELKAAQSVKSQTYSFLDLSAKTIPKKGEVIRLIGAANMIQGGSIDGYTEEPAPFIQGWAKKICEAISLDVCGFDVFIENYPTSKMKIKVIELNASPGIHGIYLNGKQETTYRIWNDIMKAYFNRSI